MNNSFTSRELQEYQIRQRVNTFHRHYDNYVDSVRFNTSIKSLTPKGREYLLSKNLIEASAVKLKKRTKFRALPILRKTDLITLNKSATYQAIPVTFQ